MFSKCYVLESLCFLEDWFYVCEEYLRVVEGVMSLVASLLGGGLSVLYYFYRFIVESIMTIAILIILFYGA